MRTLETATPAPPHAESVLRVTGEPAVLVAAAVRRAPQLRAPLTARNGPAWLVILGLQSSDVWLVYVILVASTLMAVIIIPEPLTMGFWLIWGAFLATVCIMLRMPAIRWARDPARRDLRITAAPDRLRITVDGAPAIDAPWAELRVAELLLDDEWTRFRTLKVLDGLVLAGPDGTEVALSRNAVPDPTIVDVIIAELHEHGRIALELP